MADKTAIEWTHATWADLLDATPPGWFVGTPVYHVERDQWAALRIRHDGEGEDRQAQPRVDRCGAD